MPRIDLRLSGWIGQREQEILYYGDGRCGAFGVTYRRHAANNLKQLFLSRWVVLHRTARWPLLHYGQRFEKLLAELRADLGTLLSRVYRVPG